jgi:hypothetical protein
MGKIAILGLGPSLSLYTPEYDYTIGVNDIWRIVKTDAVVCLDYPKVFKPDRLKIINECTPQVFYSSLVIWDTRTDFKKIDLIDGYPDNFCRLDLPKIHKSYCSPFVAAEIAYKYHDASEIHLFGVDMTNHPHLGGEIGVRIKKHFINLKKSLTEKGCKLIIHGEGILKNI